MTILHLGLTRRHAAALAAAALCGLAALPGPAAAGSLRGHLYTSTNDPAGNMLLVYARSVAGGLTQVAQLPTGGNGTGAGLGSQGAVTLSQDGQYLFVVNAGSRSVSTFTLGASGATLASTVDTGGDMPTSVTEAHGVVYVLNAGGDGNVSGFRNTGGALAALPDGVRALSGAGVAPAQVAFDRTARTLVVSERNSNLLTTWAVHADGALGSTMSTPSAGATPFGFSFDAANHLLVSEAQGGAELASSISSYRFGGGSPRTPDVITAALGTQQTAACWTAVTPDGRLAFTANAGSGSVSSFRVDDTGALTLWQSVAEGSDGAHPTDMAVSPSGKRLYVLEGGLAVVGSFAIRPNGHLGTPVTAAVPATAAGLAAD